MFRFAQHDGERVVILGEAYAAKGLFPSPVYGDVYAARTRHLLTFTALRPSPSPSNDTLVRQKNLLAGAASPSPFTGYRLRLRCPHAASVDVYGSPSVTFTLKRYACPPKKPFGGGGVTLNVTVVSGLRSRSGSIRVTGRPKAHTTVRIRTTTEEMHIPRARKRIVKPKTRTRARRGWHGDIHKNSLCQKELCRSRHSHYCLLVCQGRYRAN
jgi:hypothetical protein